jgi:hypothetical protein
MQLISRKQLHLNLMHNCIGLFLSSAGLVLTSILFDVGAAKTLKSKASQGNATKLWAS